MGSALSSIERRILSTTGILLVIGLAVLFSASGVLALERHGSEFYFFKQQLFCAFIGLALLFFFWRIRLDFLRRMAFPLIILQIALTALTLFPSFSHAVQGVTRWVRLGPIQFQPSELAKITIPIYLAYLICMKETIQLNFKRWLILISPILLVLFLIYRQPDLGSTVLLGATIIGALFVAGLNPIVVLLMIAAGIGLFTLATMKSAYRRRRWLAFVNPWSDPQGSGFQAIQSFLAFYQGKFFGVGLGNGNSKLFYLPEVHTDFIYSLVGEELGFIGAFGILLLFAYLGYQFFKAVRHAPNTFVQILGFSLAFTLMLQVFVNVAGVVGLIPIKGLPLPFFSWGRSALIVNLGMVGLLLNVARTRPAEVGEKKAKKKRTSRTRKIRGKSPVNGAVPA